MINVLLFSTLPGVTSPTSDSVLRAPVFRIALPAVQVVPSNIGLNPGSSPVIGSGRSLCSGRTEPGRAAERRRRPAAQPRKGLRLIDTESRLLLRDCYDCPLGIESAARNPEFQRLIRLQTEAFAKNTPYHSLELTDGTVIPGIIPVANLRARLDSLPPARRSARQTRARYRRGFRLEQLRSASGAALKSSPSIAWNTKSSPSSSGCGNRRSNTPSIDIEELTPERFGFFDYVLFFGVLYHLRHPLLCARKRLLRNPRRGVHRIVRHRQ